MEGSVGVLRFDIFIALQLTALHIKCCVQCWTSSWELPLDTNISFSVVVRGEKVFPLMVFLEACASRRCAELCMLAG